MKVPYPLPPHQLTDFNNFYSISDSAYGDVSHGHDPSYNAHDISAELRAQTEGVAITTNMDGGPAYGQDNMMMAPAPEGYSTPSRRVIREIIV